MNARVVEAARRWLGTPYVHRASCCGAGADCLGLVRGVWREVIGPEPEALPPYSMDWGEHAGDEQLWRMALRHLRPVSGKDGAAGTVLLFRMRANAVAKHLGIQISAGPDARFIHAYGPHGVVESALSLPWRRRVVAQFEFPKEE